MDLRARPHLPELRPATRTPSSRTGRAGAYSRSSRSATAVTSSPSQVGSATVCARVTVEKSSRRTLIPIVRPRRPCASRLAHSSPDIRRSASRRAAGSRMSSSKVRSRDSETTLRAAPTSPSCSKRARRPQLAPEVRAEALDEQLLGRGADGGERRQAQLAPAAPPSSGRCRGRARARPRRSARTPARG